MDFRVAESMAGAVQDVGQSNTLSIYKDARAGRCQRMTKTQSSS